MADPTGTGWRRIAAGAAAVGLVAGALGACTAPPARGEPTARTMIEIGFPGGLESQVTDVNDHGQVVGYTGSFYGGGRRAYLWERGSIRDISSPEAAPPVSAEAVKVTNRGEVLVRTCICDRSSRQSTDHRSYVWSRGRITYLAPLNGTYVVAADINERGQVVGLSGGGDTDQEQRRAVLWENGQVRDLGRGAALAVNDRGQVLIRDEEGLSLWQQGTTTRVGTGSPFILEAADLNDRGTVVFSDSDFVGGERMERGWIWRDGRLTRIPGVPSTNSCAPAMLVNDRGQIAGAIAVGERCHAALRQGAGPAQDLGAQAGPGWSNVAAINKHGDVAGYVDDESHARAKLWTRGHVVDLGRLPGADSSRAVDVNDHGWVVARSGTDATRTIRSFLSVPSPGGG